MKIKKPLYGILAILFLVAILQGMRIVVHSFVPEVVTCNSAGPLGVPIHAFWLILIGFFAFLYLALQWLGRSWEASEWPWLVVLGAGLSNLWERVKYGCVSDYFNFVFSFNVADTLLTLGVIALIYYFYFKQQRRGL